MSSAASTTPGPVAAAQHSDLRRSGHRASTLVLVLVAAMTAVACGASTGAEAPVSSRPTGDEVDATSPGSAHPASLASTGRESRSAAESTATGPASTDPTPTGPASTDPTPTGSASTDPTSTGGASTGPTSTDPTSTGPTPTGATSTGPGVAMMDPAPPGTIFVAPDGNGDGRSVDAPLGSITAALLAAGPGDVVVLGGGTYREDVVVSRPVAGSEAEPVVVRAAAGERPVVNGLVRLTDLRHWRITGMNVTWPENGRSYQHLVKLTGGDSWTFGDAEVWGARSFAAILVAGTPTRYRLTGLHVHGTASTNGINQDHLIYLNAGGGPGIVERSLLVGSPNGRAIKIGPATADGPPVANITVRYNTMADNLGPSNIQLSGRTSGVVITNNLFLRPQPGRNAVTAFELQGDGNLVVDNVAWQASGVLDRHPSLVDGGGNRVVDPALVGPGFEPADPAALDAGHLAP